MRVAVIGGSGLSQWHGVQWRDLSLTAEAQKFGVPSAMPCEGNLETVEFVFLPRHGGEHSIAPHKINYQANLWALKSLGVTHILAVNAVGGLADHLGPGVLAIPDQLIDYTWGRESSFCDGVVGDLDHIDFTRPFSDQVRLSLLKAAHQLSLPCVDGGVYACTQGPRLETAAEVKRLQSDGCDLVGMTAMPEAVLARELGMAYGSVNLVVNWGAGMTEETITMDDISKVLADGMSEVKGLLIAAIRQLQS